MSNQDTADKPVLFVTQSVYDSNGEMLEMGKLGIKLRDYLAAHALAGLLSNPEIAKDMVKGRIGADENQRWHAVAAYGFADALLEARKP